MQRVRLKQKLFADQEERDQHIEQLTESYSLAELKVLLNSADYLNVYLLVPRIQKRIVLTINNDSFHIQFLRSYKNNNFKKVHRHLQQSIITQLPCIISREQLNSMNKLSLNQCVFIASILRKMNGVDKVEIKDQALAELFIKLPLKYQLFLSDKVYFLIYESSVA